MPKTLPRCVFGAGTPHQCRRPGIGQPPLCRQHYATAETIEETHHPSNDVLSTALNIILSHPKVSSLLDDAKELLSQAATAPTPHHAEWPPPPPNSQQQHQNPTTTGEDPRVVLGFSADATLTRASIKTRERELAALYHPDCGGSDEAMKRLNMATEQLLAQLP